MKRISQLTTYARPMLLALHPLYAPVALASEMEKLLDTRALVEQNDVGQPYDKQMFEGEISDMPASIDTHSQYLVKEATSDMDRENSPEYFGIRVEVEHTAAARPIARGAANRGANRSSYSPHDANSTCWSTVST